MKMTRALVAFYVHSYNQLNMQIEAIRKMCVASAGLGLILFAGTAAADLRAVENDFDLASLQSGEILLQTIHGDKPGGAARVTALFHTTADAVWEVIGDCKYEFIYVRGLKVCEVLKPGRQHMLMHHRLRNSWYTPTLDFTFEVIRKPGNFGEARLVEGDLRVLEGLWRLVPLADGKGVIVIHEIRIQPKMPAPRWLVRRSLRNDLPDMLACIRGLANASADNRRIAADLKRCPGDISGVLK